jgi:hypothetical protein
LISQYRPKLGLTPTAAMTKYSPVENPATDRSATPKDVRHRLSLHVWRLVAVVLSTFLFALTAWFAASTFSGKPERQANRLFQSHFAMSFGSTVVILRVIQGLTSTLTAIAVSQAYESMQWMLTCREEGIQLLSFLSLSPSTGIWGVVKLGFGKSAQLRDRAFAVLRYVGLS